MASFKKKIFVTGGYGFVGSRLIEKLDAHFTNSTIICFDKMTYAASFSNLDKKLLKNEFIFIKGDVVNFDKLLRLTKDVDYIINCCAESHVDKSFNSSLAFMNTNIIGSRNIFECARVNNITKTIQISTDEVFGEVIKGSANEDSKLFPTNPYSASKAAAEMVANSYIKSFKTPINIIRGNNLFGIKQYHEKIIPYTCYCIAKNKKVNLHGGGEVFRKFLHVDDFCSAIILVLNKSKKFEHYNVGTSNRSIKIYSLVKKITDILDVDHKKIIKFVDDRPFNDLRYSMNSDKIKNLKWHEKIKFDEALPEICNWYLKKFS
jgi:UDP-glucose 4,6-dehydratase